MPWLKRAHQLKSDQAELYVHLVGINNGLVEELWAADMGCARRDRRYILMEYDEVRRDVEAYQANAKREGIKLPHIKVLTYTCQSSNLHPPNAYL